MTKIKSLRHNERLRENRVFPKGSLHSSVEMVIPSQKVVNGIVRKCSESKVFDPVEHFNQFDANDFALENIIAAGAVDMLKDAGTVAYSNIENASIVDAAVSSMELSIENNNENKIDE